MLNAKKLTLIIINITGGAAVLGSYAHGILAHPETAGLLWGNVPTEIIPLYTASMFSAAAGYLAFTFFILFRLDPGTVKIAGRFNYKIFYAIYAAILAPSALWMPLTFYMLANPSPCIWTAIRTVLAIVGISSVGMLAALALIRPVNKGPAYILALIGAAAFIIQTGILDAIVWTAYFPAGY
ncbi:MAG: hypothetical protein MUD12_06140 [Spirochaetes bacterium]|nr:hypothetical protein [Spirochaetota bacterium]